MTLSRRALLATAAAAAAVPAVPARAQGSPTIRIGVLNDRSGPYANIAGQTSVICTQQALEDFGASAKGLNVEVISADHQNKPDIAVSIARQWFDRDGVDLLLDVPTSSVALALQGVVREKNKVYINSGAASAALTGEQCSPNFIHWSYDTYMLARSTGGAMVKAGGSSWFFLTADYAFGKKLQSDTTNLVTASGGKVLGAATYPFPGTTDFSSFLVQGQSSGAKVLGICNAGADTVNSIKQAHEFGLPQSMKLAAMLMFITDVHALGQPVAQGLSLTESFYWDLNDRTRALTARIRPKLTKPSQLLNMVPVGNYGAVLHYLKAVAQIGIPLAKISGRDAVAQMKSMPTDDDAFGPGVIREDGRKLHPAFLLEAKKPSESKGDWDLLRLVSTTPADKAFRPMSEGHCAMIKA